MTLGSVVDWGDVAQVAWASLAAGLGVTFAYSLAIIGATRAVDLRRDGHPAAAAVYAVVMVLGIVATGASIVLGIVVMTAKD